MFFGVVVDGVVWSFRCVVVFGVDSAVMYSNLLP